MYVSIASRTGGRKYLSIVHGYRDENGKVRKKTIRSLGYLDELENEYEDPIAHFKAVAKEMDTQLQSILASMPHKYCQMHGLHKIVFLHAYLHNTNIQPRIVNPVRISYKPR